MQLIEQTKTSLILLNTEGQQVKIECPESYDMLVGHYLGDDYVICVFNNKKDANSEERRRNVFMFGDDGKLRWQIEDKINAFARANHPNYELVAKQEKEIGSTFVNVFESGGRLIANDGESEFEIETDTGHINYLGTYRF